jgi:hypothetical protein
MTLRKPLRLQPLRQAPRFRLLSWDFQPLSFDQYAAPGESTLPTSRNAVLMLLYAGSFGLSASAWSELALSVNYWHDNRQRLTICHLLYLIIEYF